MPVNQRCKPHEACVPPPGGVLLPRILGAGRTWLRRHCLCLETEPIPAAGSPLRPVSLSPAGAPTWTPLPCDAPRLMRLMVCIPVELQLQDACGCTHAARSSIEAELCLNLACPRPESWRAQLLLQPCVRLVCAEPSRDCCFRVQAEVLLEGWLVRWEPCQAACPPPRPACPELPLYPQPCF